MLKIKDNVDLKELEKFGWIPYDTTTRFSKGEIEWYYKDIFLKLSYRNSATMYIEVVDRKIILKYDNKKGDQVIFADDNLTCEYIQDLIQAGLVEKVVEECS